MEAESLDLRAGPCSGLSPRSPRAHQDFSAMPLTGDLTCHELRHVGKAVAEANQRMRENFHQAPPAVGRPRSPVRSDGQRSSLKKVKGGMASAGPLSARGGGNHTGRKGSASNATSGTATPTPATRPHDAAAMPQAALVALRAEIVQRSSSGATLAPAASMGSLHDAPHGAASLVSLATGTSMGSLHEAPHGAASSCSTNTPRSTATVSRMTSAGVGEERKAELEEGIQRTEHRITELRAEIEQFRMRRGGSPDAALRERGETVERQRSAKEERSGPPQVTRMLTPHSSRTSAPPCLPRTPHRQVSTDEAIVLVTAAQHPTPRRQGCQADDVDLVATTGWVEGDHRRGVVAEVSNRVRFDDIEELDEELGAWTGDNWESEQTCRRRWESPKTGPGSLLPPGTNHMPSVFYTMPTAVSETPAVPTAVNVPVPAFAATAAPGSAAKQSSSEAAAIEAEIADVRRRQAEALERAEEQRRHAEALQADLERLHQQRRQEAKNVAMNPRTSRGGA